MFIVLPSRHSELVRNAHLLVSDVAAANLVIDARVAQLAANTQLRDVPRTKVPQTRPQNQPAECRKLLPEERSRPHSNPVRIYPSGRCPAAFRALDFNRSTNKFNSASLITIQLLRHRPQVTKENLEGEASRIDMEM